MPSAYPPIDLTKAEIKILKKDVFCAPSGFNNREANGQDVFPLITLKNCAFVMTNCLVKLSRLILLTSTCTSCWRNDYLQPVPKEGGCCSPSNYHAIVLFSCLTIALNESLPGKF